MWSYVGKCSINLNAMLSPFFPNIQIISVFCWGSCRFPELSLVIARFGLGVERERDSQVYLCACRFHSKFLVRILTRSDVKWHSARINNPSVWQCLKFRKFIYPTLCFILFGLHSMYALSLCSSACVLRFLLLFQQHAHTFSYFTSLHICYFGIHCVFNQLNMMCI